jgi:hypothetical protein
MTSVVNKTKAPSMNSLAMENTIRDTQIHRLTFSGTLTSLVQYTRLSVQSIIIVMSELQEIVPYLHEKLNPLYKGH